MDYIVISRQDYIDFQIKDHHRPQLSPDDIYCWRNQLTHEFDRMVAFSAARCNPRYFRLQNKIAIALAFTFMMIGIIATAYMAWNTIL